jgi:hypothetical protein
MPDGCGRIFATGVVNALNPFSLSLATAAEPMAACGAARTYNQALDYAASRPNVVGGKGLLYPLKSSVFRGMLQASTNWAASAPGLNLDFALLQGLGEEMDALRMGKCR